MSNQLIIEWFDFRNHKYNNLIHILVIVPLMNLWQIKKHFFFCHFRMKMETTTNCFSCANARANSQVQRCFWFLQPCALHAWAFWLDWLFIVGCSCNECISTECAICHTMETLMIIETCSTKWIRNFKIWKLSKLIQPHGCYLSIYALSVHQ